MLLHFVQVKAHMKPYTNVLTDTLQNPNLVLTYSDY